MAANNTRQITLEILGDAKSLSAASAAAQRDLKNLEGAAEGVSGKMGGLGAVFSSLKGSAGSELQRALSSVTGSMGPLGGAIDGLVKSGGALNPVMVGVAGGIAATATVAKVTIGAYLDLAASVQKFKDISGASAQDASRLVAALDDVNVSADAGSKAFGALAKNADSKTFAALGIELAKTKTGATDLTGTFENVLRKLDGMSDPIQRANVLNAAFGKSWTEILPLIDKGADGFERILKANEKSGQILSDKDLQSAKDFKASMDELGDAFHKFVLETGKFALPIVKVIVDDLTKFGEGLDKAGGFVADLIHKMGPLETVAKVVGAAFLGLPVALHALINISFDKVESGLQRLVDIADKIAGPFINFPDDIFHNKQEVVSAAVGHTVDSLQALVDRANEVPDALSNMDDSALSLIKTMAAMDVSVKESAAQVEVFAGTFGNLRAQFESMSPDEVKAFYGEISRVTAAAAAQTEVDNARLLKSIVDVDAKVKDAQDKVTQAQVDGHDKIAKAYADLQKTADDGAERIAAAKAKEVKAHEDGDAAIAKAADALAKAFEKGARAVEDAKAAQVAAVKKANDDIASAERALVDVAFQAQRDRAKAMQDVADAAWNGDRRIEEADANLARVRESTTRDIEKALLRRNEADEKAASRVQDAVDKVAQAHQDGDQKVTDALRHQQDVAVDAGQRIADAEAGIAAAAEEGSQRVKDAKESAAEAAESAADRIKATEESAADNAKSADKSVADARKNRDRTIKDGNKDILKAEKDYADAVKKSGAGSEEAASAAERLQEVRENTAERIADAVDRVKEAEQRATDARVKGEKDVTKAKADATKSAEDNAAKIAKAEKDAADAVIKAQKDRDKAIADGAKAATDAQDKVTQAQIQAAADVKAAEKDLGDARKEQDRTRQQGIDDTAEAQRGATEKVNDAEVKLGDERAARALAIENAANHLNGVILANDVRETESRGKVQLANDAKVEAEKNGIADVKLKQAELDEARKTGAAQVETATKTADAAIAQAAKDTQKTVAEETGKMKKAWDDVKTARKDAAEKSQTAEENLTTAMEDQRLKLLDLHAQALKNQQDFSLGVTTMIGDLGRLGTAILHLPSMPTVPNTPGTPAPDGSGDGSGSGSGGNGSTGAGGGGEIAPGLYQATPYERDPVTGGTKFDSNGNPVMGSYSAPAPGNAFATANAGAQTQLDLTQPAAAAATAGAAAPAAAAAAVSGGNTSGVSNGGDSHPSQRRGGSLSWRNNNPGNIRHGSFATAHGAIGENGGFAVFPTYAVGRAAVKALLQSSSYINLSIHNAFFRYAPPADNNNSEAYGNSVAAAIGVPSSTIVRNLTSAQMERMLDQIQRVEGWKVGTVVGGAAGVDLSGIPVGGIPTNAGGGGASLAEVAGAGVVNASATFTGGPTVYASAMAPGTTTYASAGSVPVIGFGPTINGDANMHVTGTVPASVVNPATVAAEREIARQRAIGALAEARVQTRRDEMLALENLAAKLRDEELAKQEGITDSKELERLHAEVVAAQAKAAAADEARIAADRAAGVDSEAASADSRDTGLSVEQEILRIRGESITIEEQRYQLMLDMNAAQKAAVEAAVAAAAASGKPSIDSGGREVLIGSYNVVPSPSAFVGYGSADQTTLSPQMQFLGWQARRSAYLVSNGWKVDDLPRLYPSGVPSWWSPGAALSLIGPDERTKAGNPVTGPAAGSGSGSGSARADAPAADAVGKNGVAGPGSDASRGNATDGSTGSPVGTIETLVQAPANIYLDGKLLAEVVYEYTKDIARRNGDKLADGSWRVSKR